MPTIEASYSDLCALVGKKLPREKLSDELLYAKCELDVIDGDVLKIDVKDTNRPDLWSTEGIAREIAGRHGKKGLPKYTIKKGKCEVVIDTKSPIQPMAASLIARNVKITGHALSQIIQLQEKLALTFGRNRKSISMGVYDLDKMKLPVKYTSMRKTKIKFSPLGISRKLTVDEILKTHQKGKEFAHLMEGAEEYPVWVDADDKILSMPPIINSNDLGNITTKTRNLFVECTGYDPDILGVTINVLAAQLLERGYSVESVTNIAGGERFATPDMTPKKYSADADYIAKTAGIKLTEEKILDLARSARYDCFVKGGKIHVLYPAYRQDIMNQRDIVEDILISFGYNNMQPQELKIQTRGRLDSMNEFADRVSEICVGLGLQEIMTYTLTNKATLFERMNVNDAGSVEIENPISKNWRVFRTWLIPKLLEFFSNNMHVEYPQKIFEIGTIVGLDTASPTKTRDDILLSIAITASSVNYDAMSSHVDAVMRGLGLKYTFRPAEHRTFIAGRVADVCVGNRRVGIVGEIHPEVLANWGLEKPALAAELNLSELYNIKKSEARN